jgi:nucleoside-diphosphate-sugar epimerase
LISADWSGVDSLDRNSKLIQSANLNRIKSLADVAIQIGVDTFITFGSQAENGPINTPAEEINYDCATTSYGQAKIELRKLLNIKFEKSGTRFIWGRIFSTYGPQDNPNWLLPSMINSLNAGKSFSLTSGDQVWSYLHAYDFCLAIDQIINHGSIQGVINIGNENTMTIREIVSHVGYYMDKLTLLQFGNSEYRNDQVMFLQPKTTKLNSVGWRPQVELFDGLDDLINWHQKGTCKFSFENLYQLIN